MDYKFGYTIPINLKVFQTHYDYFNGMGSLSQDECIDRSLLVSGVKLVDEQEYEDYIINNQLNKIFTLK